MTLFPAGIEIINNKRADFFYDAFALARSALHQKLACISDLKAIFSIPRQELFTQVSLVVEELLEFEEFDLSTREQTILTRVLAFDLLESQGSNALVNPVLN